MSDDSSFETASKQNVLFGILAVKAEYIDLPTLVDAVDTWVLDNTRPLSQILREQDKLTVAQQLMIEALVEERLPPVAVGRKADGGRQNTESSAELPSADCLLPSELSTASTSNGIHASSVARWRETGKSRYRVLRPHAKGGLGEIFVAKDQELEREVALKEIQPEHAHDPSFRGRFVREAKITGGLEHPGIVPVYSLGTHADGRPYYAMRFVNGVNLKEAIERFHETDNPGRDRSERRLEFRKLLRRFVDICNAIGFAHSRGVLHRDLKPGNVMLGSFGETLIVDWGLAKTLVSSHQSEEQKSEVRSQESEFASGNEVIETQPGDALGTPAYMSPEQAAGHIDLLGPAADIYGLGATLYTVLTGRPPFNSTDRGDLLCAVQRGDFAPPRQIKKDVPAALEAICLKAMAFEPGDRYASALELANDIEHWLADEPVAAYREPWRERTRRFLRKHRTMATSAAAMLVVTVVLSSGAALRLNVARAGERQARFDETMQKEVAQRAEKSATEAKDRAEAVAQFLVDAFRAPNPKRDGRNIKLVDVLERAVESLRERFVNDPATRGRLLGAFGKTYEALGLPDRAVELLKEAREIMIQTLGADDDETLLTSIHLEMAHRDAEHWPEREILAEEIHRRYQSKFGPDHPKCIGTKGDLAQAYADSGKVRDALPMLEEVVGKLRTMERNSNQARIVPYMSSLAGTYQQLRRPAEALPLFEEVYTWRKENMGPDHHYTLLSMMHLALVYQDVGRRSEALASLEECHSLWQDKFGPEHPGTFHAAHHLGRAYVSAEKADKAVPILEPALQVAKTQFGPDHAFTLATMTRLATAYHELGRLSDALPLWEEAARRIKARNGPKDHETLTAMDNLGALYREMERHQDALTLLQETLAIRREVHPNSPALARTLTGVGACWNDQGAYESAESLLREAFGILESKKHRTLLRYSVEVRLGETLARQQKYTEAEPLLIAGYEGLRAQENLDRAARARLVESVEWLIRLYKAIGDTAKEREWEGRRLPPDPRR